MYACRRIVATFALALAPTSLAAELSDRLETYRQLRLAELGRDVTDARGTIGSLELELDSGTVYPVLTDDGMPAGLYFEGRGRYRFTSTDPADRQTLADNLRHHGLTDALSADGSVLDGFDRLLLFSAGTVPSELLSEASAEVALRADVVSAFGRRWRRALETSVPFGHLALEARDNASLGEYVYAEIEGSERTVGYSRDTLRWFSEDLFVFRELNGVERRLRIGLSDQPIDGGHGRNEPLVALRHVELGVAQESDHHGRIDTRLEMTVRRDGTRVVPLALLNNRDDRDDHWSSPRNALRVSRVTDGEDRQLAFSHRYGELLVELNEPAAAGTGLELNVASRGDVFVSAWADRADNYFELFLSDWFPRPFAWGAQRATVEARVSTRKPFVPVASGRTVSFRPTADGHVLTTRTDAPVNVSNFAVFGGKYRHREEKLGDVTVRVFGYAATQKSVLTKMPKLVHAFIQVFEALLGPYPFDELDVVEVPEIGRFGIAPAGVSLLSSAAFDSRQSTEGRFVGNGFGDRFGFEVELDSRFINSIVAHEVAHQWFGYKVVPEDSRANWISESFAEYLSGMAMAITNPDERKVAGMKAMMAGWRADARRSSDVASIEAANLLAGPNAYGQRRDLLYARGPLVLHMLRTMIGEERFSRVLRGFLDEADMGTADTDDFSAALNQVMGMDMSWFADQWIRHPGIPQVSVEHDVVEEAGAFVLTGRVAQPEEGFKRLFLPLVLDFGDTREVRLVIQHRPVQTFRFPLQRKPRRVQVDPMNNNLADYR